MISKTHSSWRVILKDSLASLELEYQNFLKTDTAYFPDSDNFLNAFKTLPLDSTKYILFGQDPYPRFESAIGYAFIDAKVKTLFGTNGFSKEVNKATSLRNMMKMLLSCEGELTNDFSKDAVKRVDSSKYIDSIYSLRDNFETNGVLLLNSALIFTDKKQSTYHAKMWRPFVDNLLKQIENKDIKLILFGNISKEIDKLPSSKNFEKILLPHPYNLGFITNNNVKKLFCDMKLLREKL